MDMIEKWKRFFKDNGIEKQWFARQIGVSPTYFYQVIHGRQNLTAKYFDKIVSVSNGKISLSDLVEDHFKDAPALSIVKGNTSYSCEVTIKRYNED
jgi:DNA-binding transcriptional regulator YdaS (Cro superfamily)